MVLDILIKNGTLVDGNDDGTPFENRGCFGQQTHWTVISWINKFILMG